MHGECVLETLHRILRGMSCNVQTQLSHNSAAFVSCSVLTVSFYTLSRFATTSRFIPFIDTWVVAIIMTYNFAIAIYVGYSIIPKVSLVCTLRASCEASCAGGSLRELLDHALLNHTPGEPRTSKCVVSKSNQGTLCHADSCLCCAQ